MRVIDATPPKDFPDQVIIAQNPDFIERHPDAAYYLRVKAGPKKVNVHPLPGAIGPSVARDMARRMGFEPTHYTMPGSGYPCLF